MITIRLRGTGLRFAPGVWGGLGRAARSTQSMPLFFKVGGQEGACPQLSRLLR
jgi:hypothetical protein